MATGCDWCGRTIGSTRKRFCCNSHKDKWHNRARMNQTDWDDAEKLQEEVENDMHPFDSYSLGQE